MLRTRIIPMTEGHTFPVPMYLHNDLMKIMMVNDRPCVVFVEHDVEPLKTSPRLDSDVECSGGTA